MDDFDEDSESDQTFRPLAPLDISALAFLKEVFAFEAIRSQIMKTDQQQQQKCDGIKNMCVSDYMKF